MKEIKGNNKIRELASSTMKELGSMVDVNTVVGKPFATVDGTSVIPISKVTMGFMTGGGEYGEVKLLKNDDVPFAGGSGAVVSLKPVGFLLSKDGEVKLISTDNDVYTRLFNCADELINKLKNESNI